MKAFIWHGVDQVSTMYHSNGGLLVVAETLQDARNLIVSSTPVDPAGDTEDTALAMEPDEVLELSAVPERKLHVFPDAGCC